MAPVRITDLRSRDLRFDLPEGAGSDAVHTDPQYGYAVAVLETDGPHAGTGLAFTLGEGTELVCGAIELLGEELVGRELESLMGEFGAISRALADHHRLRWLGPHKGVIHLALAAITNGCFDLWARKRGLPLWKLLLDLDPEAFVDLLDLSYVEGVCTREEAVALLREHDETRASRTAILEEGYPAYDTSVGWAAYSEEELTEKARAAVDRGFGGVKMKVGAGSIDRDVRRLETLRGALGPEIDIMTDANQQWSVGEAMEAGVRLAPYDPYWIEEPTHPDDVAGHQSLARGLPHTRIALGEHVPNRVVFKNYLQEGAADVIQCDTTRIGGVSEFLTVSLMARTCEVPIIPHAGEVGQIHQHLVLVNHVAIGHPATYLEYIPHLAEYFAHPASVESGRYLTPQEPGAGTELAA